MLHLPTFSPIMSVCQHKSATILFMAKDDYDNWDKQQLVDEIRALKKRKRYGLVWEDKPEQVAIDCETNLPVLEEVKNMAIATGTDMPTNLMIEGDNYHALSALNYTHKGKIDVIYIDPPYNTGAKDWKYNNNYVNKNDDYPHSKWINFMEKRLYLTKDLLSPKGFICVTIDHHELFALGLLMDELYGEHNRCGIISVLMNSRGRQFSNSFSATTEFYLVYAKNKSGSSLNTLAIDEEIKESFTEEDEHGLFKWNNFIRLANIDKKLKNRKEDYCYPIYVSPNLAKISLDKKPGYHEVLPRKKGQQKCWQTMKSSFFLRLQDAPTDFKAFREEGEIVIKKKYREQQFFTTHWINEKYNSTFHGTRLLESIIGKDKFEYPKSLYAVMDLLKITAPKDGVILDFFAGSGTTGHAVSMLNKEDGGNRRFILCTNNESNIARDVCYPRIKTVIKGHKKRLDITGVPSNLKYYKTTFVSASPTDDNKVKIMRKAADMLCVRENTFEEVKICQSYRIYRNANHHTGIIYTESAIDNFKKYAAKIRGIFHVYIFSLGKEDYAEEFTDMSSKVQTHPIPEEILRAYRQISQKRSVK